MSWKCCGWNHNCYARQQIHLYLLVKTVWYRWNPRKKPASEPGLGIVCDTIISKIKQGTEMWKHGNITAVKSSGERKISSQTIKQVRLSLSLLSLFFRFQWHLVVLISNWTISASFCHHVTQTYKYWTEVLNTTFVIFHQFLSQCGERVANSCFFTQSAITEQHCHSFGVVFLVTWWM